MTKRKDLVLIHQLLGVEKLVCLLWSIVVCSIISIVLNKFCPILVGKGKIVIKK